MLGGASAGVLALQSGRDEQQAGAAVEPASAKSAAAPAASAAAKASPSEPATAATNEPAPATTEPATTPGGERRQYRGRSRRRPAAAKDDVTLSFVVTPADAEIRVDGVALAEHRLTAPRSSPRVVVEVARDGYVSKKREVSFESDREIEVILQKSPRARRPARQPGRRPGKPERESPGEKRIITDSPYD